MTTAFANPTEAQLKYVLDLVKEREIPSLRGLTVEQAVAKTRLYVEAPHRTRAEVSRLIDTARTAPRRVAAAPVPAFFVIPDSVPNSKFAIPTELLTTLPESWRRQELLFLEVKELRGTRRANRLLGAPGRFNRLRIGREVLTELCEVLSKDDVAWQAIKRFSDEYSVCGRCAASLTDDASRERGIGPVCWSILEVWKAAYSK